MIGTPKSTPSNSNPSPNCECGFERFFEKNTSLCPALTAPNWPDKMTLAHFQKNRKFNFSKIFSFQKIIYFSRDKPALIVPNWLDNSTFCSLLETFDEDNFASSYFCHVLLGFSPKYFIFNKDTWLLFSKILHCL